MEIIIKGDAKEIAALVFALQEQQHPTVLNYLPRIAEGHSNDLIIKNDYVRHF